jgi:hypothetical protein
MLAELRDAAPEISPVRRTRGGAQTDRFAGRPFGCSSDPELTGTICSAPDADAPEYGPSRRVDLAIG